MNLITELMPGIDLLSTFFTLAYIIWLVSREWCESNGDFYVAHKRSLMDQHITDRHVAYGY